ncbi:MAG: contact-dependent growth inhibition system immunity protein [Anaerotignum sp.]|nr:contact-dependent growth inhibition system immunity protein [Anaerotignum sp.]
MEYEKKIKVIWKCSYIESETELYPLQKWYNQLIDKKVSEIEISDVLRMIRQNEFIDIAIPKAVEFLKINPFVGEMYEGELLEKVSKLEKSVLIQYIQELRKVLESAFINNKTYEWMDEDERIDFEKVIDIFLKKITAK